VLVIPVTFSVLLSLSAGLLLFSVQLIVTGTSLWLGGQTTDGDQVIVPASEGSSVPMHEDAPLPPPWRAAAGTATATATPTTPAASTAARFNLTVDI
jgi:hypothetical protein